MKVKHRRFIGIFPICLLATIAFAAVESGTTGREIYLTEGGAYFLVLDRDTQGAYTLAKGGTDSQTTKYYTVSVTGTQKLLHLTLGMPGGFKLVESLVLPSGEQDWFIAKIEDCPPAYNIRKYNWRELSPPVRYLHRLDDNNIVRYFEVLENVPRPDHQNYRATPSRHLWNDNTTTAPLVEIASQILAAHPKDLWARVLFLDAAARSNRALLKDKLSEWGADFQRCGDSLLLASFAKARRAARAHELSLNGQNGYALLDNYWESSATLVQRILNLTRALQLPSAELAPTVTEPWDEAPSYLDVLNLAKVSRTIANLLLFDDRRDEAGRIFAANYRIGQWYSGDYSVLARLIGISLRDMASDGLILFVLNGCDSHEDFATLWSRLENLNRVDLKQQTEDSPDFEMTKLQCLRQTGFISEYDFRRDIAVARFQLVRMVTAARDHVVTTGNWPDSEKEFAPLLLDGPPRDPFSSNTLRFRAVADSFVCYSVGPDGRDGCAQICYDPTNGTVSDGDIMTTIPRERKYPFPRSGVRASTAEDVRKQFPNGLPPDIFAAKDRSLSVTSSLPIIIYSQGPICCLNCGQGDSLPGEPNYRPKVEYDPTNGTVSAGELLIHIPLK
ncbi:MAG: hypothetical protein K1X53_15680 [Candidatus Sumerlaeaceae bacterium]|nr:hypothetical protein [Candidatus Sumerlaeaceae bacterium]